MSDTLRLAAMALFATGPVVAALALARRGGRPGPALDRARGWRWYVPSVLLPIEWVLPPILIGARVGEVEGIAVPVRVAGLAAGLVGAGLITWASVRLGRFLVHSAAIGTDHVLVTDGPYRLIRHPVYAGYLALLLGAGVASATVSLLLIWPVSLLGIRIQLAAEERLLAARFGDEYDQYASRTGRLVPRIRRPTGPSR
jgi:protein-S-isoprenylcysteine O-methyltransferase Ste14